MKLELKHIIGDALYKSINLNIRLFYFFHCVAEVKWCILLHILYSWLTTVWIRGGKSSPLTEIITARDLTNHGARAKRSFAHLFSQSTYQKRHIAWTWAITRRGTLRDLHLHYEIQESFLNCKVWTYEALVKPQQMATSGQLVSAYVNVGTN